MKTQRKDTNDFLKECIADSLLRLMQTRSIETITVKEITEQAHVGRATYYRHFASKEAVLIFKLRYTLEQWTQTKRRSAFDLKNRREQAREFMQFFYTQRELLLVLHRNQLLHLLISAFYELAAQSEAVKHGELNPFVQAFHTFGMFGIIYHWVNTGMETPPEAVAEIILTEVFPPRQKRRTKRPAR